LIVATNALEEARLDWLNERANPNGLRLPRISAAKLLDLEPHITDTTALLSKVTGIVDYRQIAAKLAEIIISKGVEVVLESKFDLIIEKANFVEIGTQESTWQSRMQIVCVGLQADRLAHFPRAGCKFLNNPFNG
jgi:(S)-2-hydroxyglutarate dehydrogenase